MAAFMLLVFAGPSSITRQALFSSFSMFALLGWLRGSSARAADVTPGIRPIADGEPVSIKSVDVAILLDPGGRDVRFGHDSPGLRVSRDALNGARNVAVFVALEQAGRDRETRVAFRAVDQAAGGRLEIPYPA